MNGTEGVPSCLALPVGYGNQDFVKKALIKLIPFIVRQAHYERSQ